MKSPLESTTDSPHQFDSGAVRSGKGLPYSLITPIGLRRVAEAYAEGEKKYGAYNWEKGLGIRGILDHAIAHIYNYLSGDRSEDHLGHAAWNLLAACHSEETWPHLNTDLRPVKELARPGPVDAVSLRLPEGYSLLCEDGHWFWVKGCGIDTWQSNPYCTMSEAINAAWLDHNQP